MSEARASGELEGSTLGSSSRDGEKEGRAHRRTHNPSGFLVDSSFIPRSKSLRLGHHRPRHSEPDRKEKRRAPEPEPETEATGQKRRSRFSWIRHKEQPKVSPLATPSNESVPENAGPESAGPSRMRQNVESQESQAERTDPQGTVGLDRDSLQIVNLALNLSESRKKNSLGRSASSRISSGGWTAPNAPSSLSYADTQPPVAGPSARRRRASTQLATDDRGKPINASTSTAPNEQPSVQNFLPQSVGPDSLPQEFSRSTLARAEKARNYFELLSEYLRLLHSLPPLRPSGASGSSSGSPPVTTGEGRAYNPLQVIRNRKVRFRERCPLVPESQGWTDVEKVHEWVDLVESRHSQQSRSSFERLRLPPFENSSKSTVHHEDIEEPDFMPASPPSSLRRVSRTSSVKARRPRLDWLVSPAESLADAAWVESDLNKTKIIDKDGNHLYPDPASIVTSDDEMDVDAGQTRLPNNRLSVDADQHTSRTSLSSTSSFLPADLKGTDRGRRRHRAPVSPQFPQSKPAMPDRVGSKRDKLNMRSISSLSTSSTSDDDYYNSRSDYTKSYKQLQRSNVPLGRGSADDVKRMPTLQPIKPTRHSWSERRASVSSGRSFGDRYDPLTSLAALDSIRSANTTYAEHFPSIASPLSSASSRSPSPTKRLSRAVGSRSRSSIRFKEPPDRHSMESVALHKESLEGPPRSPKLGPGPPPDRAPPAQQDDPSRPSLHTRKGSIQESKLRGIFKGPGKIAGKVGNEVSKMGDLIKKKDHQPHSRKSSANSITTDENASETEDPKGEKTSSRMALLRRLPTFADESTRPRKDPDKSLKTSAPNPSSPVLTSPRDGLAGELKALGLGSPRRHATDTQLYSIGESQGKSERVPASQKASEAPARISKPERAMTFGPELHSIQKQIKKRRHQDPTGSFTMHRPPVTGLAQAQASTASSPRRPLTPLSGQSRSWSISRRSVSSSLSSGVPNKREVERTRALLLSSGVKAREITRRAESVRTPTPEFLLRAYGTDAPIPAVARLHEHDLAARRLLEEFEKTHRRFQTSLDHFTRDTSAPLRSQLSKLEDTVDQSINPRVRTTTQEAEALSIQLNTTSTLAVKQLSDALDRGVRKRHRRLRWLRRAGFVMLEWALVGMLWWVWLIVMAFKLLRGVLRGTISGVRWVLWL
ncbi:hypothetical protein P168DRAFT_289405 [Aspergillus campestris IBT 28561]|uniref:Uncharacterized protein n=1 Tax=Aspergillus campestris (strain IBT 28561) TaxID=1392248 RepID=A0A2I1D806_ASPC2|nr:uncharacterized protein P168DRAFT_289405 [Aspergillus campestris IBT 28561]PKY06010.1 hypothetical protein P168DRAFT_289405 [Aspergillus campestris IBT 28561]